MAPTPPAAVRYNSTLKPAPTPDALKHLQRECPAQQSRPVRLFELRGLKTLWLEGCRLRTLPPDIARLRELELLCIGYNPSLELLRRPRRCAVGPRDFAAPGASHWPYGVVCAVTVMVGEQIAVPAWQTLYV
jgi:hypothetical protein